jgi:gelsolin
MYDGKKIDLDQTNLMNFGSELEIKIKKAASEGEVAWKSCKEQKGVKVWRIEKFCVVPWPKNDYGNFYNGDSYIILHIFEKEKGEIKYHINMWLGSKTSVDEAGTAAYKTVELNDYLDRKAILF